DQSPDIHAQKFGFRILSTLRGCAIRVPRRREFNNEHLWLLHSQPVFGGHVHQPRHQGLDLRLPAQPPLLWQLL
ncbi:unnamed protein product, partial [Closterium sp. NIES-54]